jgi:hypothetical protein
MRGLGRGAAAASSAALRPYCRTNGCASFLDVDPVTGQSACPICGYTSRPH